MLQKILENIGLTSKEAKIYLSTLSLGSSPVSHIAKKGGLNRVTTYDILEKLIQKGFVTKHKRKDSLCFNAVDPEIIALDFRNRARDLRKSLPDFKILEGKSTYHQVQYFEGLEGIKKIHLDILNSKTEILNYVDSKSIRLVWPEYDHEYIEERVKRKIYLRGISADDEYGKRVKVNDWNCYREIRLINKDSFDFSSEINIYDNKVAIVSFSPTPLGMIIENESIARTQKAIFKMAWEFAGR